MPALSRSTPSDLGGRFRSHAGRKEKSGRGPPRVSQQNPSEKCGLVPPSDLANSMPHPECAPRQCNTLLALELQQIHGGRLGGRRAYEVGIAYNNVGTYRGEAQLLGRSYLSAHFSPARLGESDPSRPARRGSSASDPLASRLSVTVRLKSLFFSVHPRFENLEVLGRIHVKEGAGSAADALYFLTIYRSPVDVPQHVTQ